MFEVLSKRNTNVMSKHLTTRWTEIIYKDKTMFDINLLQIITSKQHEGENDEYFHELLQM